MSSDQSPPGAGQAGPTVSELMAEGAPPALVVFQTDGDPGAAGERQATVSALVQFSKLPVFWAFVGFGHEVRFLRGLDDMEGRERDNASFLHAPDPARLTDAELYEGITHEVPGWLADCRAVGLIPPRGA